MTPLLHTLTPALDRPWAAFCAAAAGGGTPPQWTEADPDTPSTWHAPVDAAGGLILWAADGIPERAEPPTQDLAAAAERVLGDLADAGLTDSVLPGTVRATYASSGGRMVSLVQQEDGCWWVAVARSDGPPRMGASERAMSDLASGNPVVLGTDSLPATAQAVWDAVFGDESPNAVIEQALEDRSEEDTSVAIRQYVREAIYIATEYHGADISDPVSARTVIGAWLIARSAGGSV
jgi:hypothetical protein